ncbi:hypothetical protein P732_04115 [Listeria monocytogenes SHL015]|nr:hypothetical protein LM5578_0749 [Listeria monocytogenes 08-5578]ADB70549.1 hypothetical protein LM5923_0704 [Listeria monocytogenes 08-5923]AGR02997.1 hypothetical protein M642_00990 [Listeria monocytogenes]EAL07229.1 hypothetical protein LMOf6854_0717 [Listeria monocytogenes str. 1/2a F6854] [Listeria monocytogenes serotype 1/2a str. F6854]KHK07852.1 hypothetical protein I612_05425 [Listeria monocytogenes SHL004]KHK13415.1 hypothetical protein I793_01690 [Listeria monocytogenes SHL001]KH
MSNFNIMGSLMLIAVLVLAVYVITKVINKLKK